MEVKTIVTGYLEENCYLIIKNGSCLVVDPGDQPEKILKAIGSLKVEGILITHRHFDHIGALEAILEKYPVMVYDDEICQNSSYQICSFSFSVLKNPGHSKDSISFYFAESNLMFVGDFVFQQSIGRYDLEGGDFNIMKKSIQKLKQYPPEIILYPGHGSFTTLEKELRYNPYFQ